MTRLRTFAIDRGGALVLVALVIYLVMAPRQIVGGDNAEMSTLGAVGGIAHPSGYPLYVLWLRAMSWLPSGSPAQTAAYATAILAALQLGVLHAACRAWGARPLAASLAVAIYAAGPLVLRAHSEAEVFPLNGLVVAAVLWLAAATGPVRGVRRCALLGLVAGLGLANNLTCVLVAPVGLVGVVRGAREARVPAAIGAAVGGLVVGLLPYLYLFVAPENTQSWVRAHDVGELLDIFLRRQYGGAFGFMGASASIDIGDQLVELAHTLARAWLWFLFPAGLGVLGLRIGRPQGEPRAGWIALAVSFVLAGPWIVTRFDVPTTGLGAYIVHRFHLLPILLLVIPVASALDLIGGMVARQVRDVIGAAIAIVVLVAVTLTSAPEVARFHSPAMENGIRGTLEGLPRDAVVFTQTDELDVGFNYLELAVGMRRDVVALRSSDVAIDWYRRHYAGSGLVMATPPVELARQVLMTGRPLFVQGADVDILRAFPSYPFGILRRVLPAGTALPSLAQVVEDNRAQFDRFDLDYTPPGPDDEFATIMHLRYAGTWKLLAAQLAAAGDDAAAKAALELGHELAPRP